MTIYNKLVRDNILDHIAAQGQASKSHIAGDAEYEAKLKEKLQEEVAEFLESGSPEEIADILEVIDALEAFYGLDPAEVARLKQEKFIKRGGFAKKIILEES